MKYEFRELVELYDNMLDETCGSFNCGELRYHASYVLKKVDPVAYRLGFFDYCDSHNIDLDNYSESIDDYIRD